VWEEDPRWQQANYRLLVWAVAIGLVGSFLISLFSGDWQLFQVFLEVLGVIVAALCIYAAFVWTVAHLGVKLLRVFRKLGHKHDDAP
jgi:chromate transport protein ChrA